jgi:hypothetical protein
MEDSLEHVAKDHGYTSSEELLAAITRGEVAVVRLLSEQRRNAMHWLYKQTGLVDDNQLEIALRSIATQLYSAQRREVRANKED